MKLEPMENGIIFRFEDETTKGEFRDVSSGGLILGFNSDRTTQQARWGIVDSIGSDVRDVTVGMRVCVEPLMWTPGFKFEGEEYWKTDEDKILLVDQK